MLENVIPKGEKRAKVAKLFYSIGDIKNGNKWMKRKTKMLYGLKGLFLNLSIQLNTQLFLIKNMVFSMISKQVLKLKNQIKAYFHLYLAIKEPAKNNVKRIKKVNHNPLAENSKRVVLDELSKKSRIKATKK